jgi:phosphotransferase system enzyme I (PtsI)
MTEVTRGLGVAAGVGVGQVYLLHAEPLPVVPDPIPPERVDEEIERFHQARERAAQEIQALKSQVKDALGSRFAGIFEAQQLVLDDPALVTATVKRIRIGRVSARWALKEVVADFLRKFESIDDDYIRERGGELADVQSRLQRLLRGESNLRRDVPQGPVVVVARDVDPSDAVLLAEHEVVGLATDGGGRTSHTAILARALALPAVVGLHDFSRRVGAGDLVLVDGDAGEVVVDPSAEQTAAAERRQAAARAFESELASARDLPAVTRDGVQVTIRANIEFPAEVERVRRFGARGIGLYRSEFLYLGHAPELPGEEEHYRTYAEVAAGVAPDPAVIRTLDLGGEKYFDRVLRRSEENPVLGLRGVRFSLARPEIFRPQLRGLLRAAAERDNIRVMLPVVTMAEEIRAVRRLLEQEASSLREEGHEVDPGLPLGIMIEVPAAALAADSLAREVDFFSIGTNDLIQYALAVDRGNEWLDRLTRPFHPGLLRLIKWVVDGGRAAGIPVALCGEMASDSRAVGLLLGLGLREFSVHPRAVGTVREAVRGLDCRRSEQLAQEALERPTASDVGQDLEPYLR